MWKYKILSIFNDEVPLCARLSICVKVSAKGQTSRLMPLSHISWHKMAWGCRDGQRRTVALFLLTASRCCSQWAAWWKIMCFFIYMVPKWQMVSQHLICFRQRPQIEVRWKTLANDSFWNTLWEVQRSNFHQTSWTSKQTKFCLNLGVDQSLAQP